MHMECEFESVYGSIEHNVYMHMQRQCDGTRIVSVRSPVGLQ